jgi:hypothetical protein
MEGQSVRAVFVFFLRYFASCRMESPCGLELSLFTVPWDSYTRHLLLHVGWDSATRHKKVSLKVRSSTRASINVTGFPHYQYRPTQVATKPSRAIRSLQLPSHTVQSLINETKIDVKRTGEPFVSLPALLQEQSPHRKTKESLYNKVLCQDSQLGELINDCSRLTQQSFSSYQATKTFR